MTEAVEPAGGAIRDDERDLVLRTATFPSGVRDFVLGRMLAGEFVPLHPRDVLKLDRAARLIAHVGEDRPAQALVLALCRLLVPCLRERGSDRHVVVEAWSDADLRGETLPVDVHTQLARDLGADQAADWRVVMAGAQPPEGTLAALFWEAHTPLPLLPDVFDDIDLGRMAKALYQYLVPPGEGQAELQEQRVRAAVEACRAAGFAPLGLSLPPRRLRALFRKLLAVAIRFAGQLTGAVAERLVERNLAPGQEPLRPAERALIELRYGACRALGDINLGFLAGCGPLLADLVNDYARALAASEAEAESEQAAAAERLRAYIWLLARFRRRRRQARAAERRDDRQHRGDRVPEGRRLPAEGQTDVTSPDPAVAAACAEELELLRTALPQLKPRDRRRLEILLECNADRAAAATRLGVPLEKFSRQLRQTVFPAVRRSLKAGGSRSV